MTKSTQRWTCPDCKRVFGKKNQSHMKCEPAVSLDEYFAQAKPFEEPIFDAVQGHIGHLDGLIVDPIGIGILLKNGPMFAELRPKTKWTALGFSLGQKLDSGRLSRKVVNYGKKYFHVINIDNPDQVDDQIAEWLIDAYHLAGGTLTRRPAVASGTVNDGTVNDGTVNDGTVNDGTVNDGTAGDGMFPGDIDDPLG